MRDDYVGVSQSLASIQHTKRPNKVVRNTRRLHEVRLLNCRGEPRYKDRADAARLGVSLKVKDARRCRLRIRSVPRRPLLNSQEFSDG